MGNKEVFSSCGDAVDVTGAGATAAEDAATKEPRLEALRDLALLKRVWGRCCLDKKEYRKSWNIDQLDGVTSTGFASDSITAIPDGSRSHPVGDCTLVPVLRGGVDVADRLFTREPAGDTCTNALKQS